MNNEKLPTLIASQEILNGFFTIRKDQLRYPDSSISDYYVLSTTKESVAVIALNPRNELLVTHEYRHPTNSVLLGCPGGLVDDGESPLEAASRELLEETGCKAKSYEILGSCFPLPGILAQKMTIVLASNTEPFQASAHEEQEVIEWEFMTQNRLQQEIISGKNVDAILCSAFLFFLLQNKKAGASNSNFIPDAIITV